MLAKVLHDLQPFHMLILFAFIDPIVVGIGLWMGRKADQAGKLFLAGLAAGLAGVVVNFLLRQVGLSWFEGGYAFGGAHAFFRVLAGGLWAAIGYASRRVI